MGLKSFFKALSNPTTLLTVGASFFIPGAPAFTLSAFATRVAITAALSTAVQALTPKPKLPSFSDFASQSQQRTQLIKQPTVARRIIYGETRASGVMGYAETTNNNKYLHLIILIATHEVNQLGTIFINDQALTLDGSGNTTAPSQFANLVRVKKHLGSDDQSADTDLISESDGKWTVDHKLSGIAYLYVRLEFNADAFPNGLPNISCLVQGKKVFDPRDSSTAYKTNPALCIRDYLSDNKYGFGASSSEIDDTSFTTAANICDETISLKAGGTEKKYTLNGTFESNATPKQTLENLLTSIGGTIVYSNGTFKIKAAKYISPTITLDDGDVRGGGVGLQTARSQRDNYNAVKGVFTSPTNNYIAADYPAYISSTFQTEDGGDRKFLDLDLPYTTSQTMAQRLSKIALFRNRQKITMTMDCSLKAFQLDVGDIVQVNNSRFGFGLKPFEVAEWGLSVNSDPQNTNLTVDLTLREINEQVYDWTPLVDEKAFQQDNTTITNPFDVAQPVMTISDELRALNETAISVLVVDISVNDEFVTDFEVQAKKTTETNYINLGKASGNRFELVQVQDDAIYDVRARSITRISGSSFVTAQHQVVGSTAPPQDVTNFSINIVGTEAHMSWTPVTDLDLSHYKIRHCRETTGGTYANSKDLISKVPRPGNTAIEAAMTGTYFIKAIDKLGNASTNATSVVAIIEDIKGLNAVTTTTQNPNFSGTRTNVAVVDNKLQLDTSLVFDSKTGNFDDGKGLFDGGGGVIQTSGSYEFDNVVDLGSVFTSRVTETTNLVRVDYVNLFEDALGQFDDRSGLFDGDPQAFDDVNTELLIATTEGDPSITVESGLTLTDTFSANTTIANSEYTRGQPVVFACEVVFPRVVDTACTLWEHGGTGHGATIGFHDTNTFRCAFGRGNNDIPTNDKTIIDIPKTLLPTDGQLHTLVWEMIPTNGSGRVFVDDVLVGSASANPSWNNTIWAGTDAGGFISQLNADSPAYTFIRAIDGGSEPNVRWKYGFSGGLRHYQNQTISATLPTFTDFRKFVVGDYKARGFKFKVNMTSTDAEATHQISNLSVKIDMPDRTHAEGNIASWGNQVPNSEAFDSWTANTNTTVTANQIANPINGQVTADEVARSGTATLRNVLRYVFNNDAGRYSISVYVKANTLTRVTLLYGKADLSGYLRAWFNLSDGSVIFSQNVGSGATLVSATIDAVGSDGWYRVSMIGDFTFTTTTVFIIYPDVFNQNPPIDGSLYLWGAQVQQSSTLPTYESYSNSTGTKTITYSPSFKDVQGIGISSSNLTTGDFYVITNESATGFTIQFKNAAGNGVGRRFDYVAKGFGEIAS